MCVCARGGGAGVPPERIAKVLTGGTSQIGGSVFSDVHSIGHTVDKIYVQSTEDKDLSKQIFFFFPSRFYCPHCQYAMRVSCAMWARPAQKPFLPTSCGSTAGKNTLLLTQYETRENVWYRPQKLERYKSKNITSQCLLNIHLLVNKCRVYETECQTPQQN